MPPFNIRKRFKSKSGKEIELKHVPGFDIEEEDGEKTGFKEALRSYGPHAPAVAGPFLLSAAAFAIFPPAGLVLGAGAAANVYTWMKRRQDHTERFDKDNKNNEHHGIVATFNDKRVGSVEFDIRKEPKTGEHSVNFDYIEVDPEHRNEGIASQLTLEAMRAVEDIQQQQEKPMNVYLTPLIHLNSVRLTGTSKPRKILNFFKSLYSFPSKVGDRDWKEVMEHLKSKEKFENKAN